MSDCGAALPGASHLPTLTPLQNHTAPRPPPAAAAPTVASCSTDAVTTGAASTLTFVTTGLINDNSRPFIKIVASDAANCQAAKVAGTNTDAQLTFVSAIQATLSVTTTVAAGSDDLKVRGAGASGVGAGTAGGGTCVSMKRARGRGEGD